MADVTIHSEQTTTRIFELDSPTNYVEYEKALSMAVNRYHRDFGYLPQSWRALAVEARAERDAALAAIERARAIHKPTLPGYGPKACVHDGRAWPCETIAALDGAPEPEWEWEYCYRSKQTGNRWGSGSLMDAQLGAKALDSVIERRVKAGPWLPVEGEKP